MWQGSLEGSLEGNLEGESGGGAHGVGGAPPEPRAGSCRRPSAPLPCRLTRSPSGATRFSSSAAWVVEALAGIGTVQEGQSEDLSWIRKQ